MCNLATDLMVTLARNSVKILAVGFGNFESMDYLMFKIVPDNKLLFIDYTGNYVFEAEEVCETRHFNSTVFYKTVNGAIKKLESECFIIQNENNNVLYKLNKVDYLALLSNYL